MDSNIFGFSIEELKKATSNEVSTKNIPEKKVNYELQIVWRNVVIFSYIHLTALYGIYLMLFQANLWTVIWTFAVGISAGLGITAGAHRFWSHRSYKAKWPMKFILMIFQTIAAQDSIYQWVRDHRVHHKFTDTDADPYNATRGFFFSHIGWLLVRKHPDIIRKGATVDVSDLKQDSIVMFQKKWYLYLMPFCSFILPTLIPCFAWGETLWNMWHITLFRYCANLNGTWSVNSAAHIWGVKPYDKSSSSTNNIGVAMLAFGEGWHNYHHAFPWDYKAAEFGNYRANLTTAFIDFFSFLGLTYDLKTVPESLIRKRILRNNNTELSHKLCTSE